MSRRNVREDGRVRRPRDQRTGSYRPYTEGNLAETVTSKVLLRVFRWYVVRRENTRRYSPKVDRSQRT